MERVVADLAAGAHRDHRLACRKDRTVVNLAFCRAPAITRCGFGGRGCEVRRELLPDGLRDRTLVVLEARESGLVCALPRSGELPPHGIVILEIEGTQQGLERQALNRERAEDDGEGGEQDEIAEWKSARQCERGGERDDPAHPGPRNHE